MRRLRPFAALAAFALLTGAAKMGPDNPTCPAEPDFGPTTAMTLTPTDRAGKRVLLAQGVIDSTLPARLKAAIERYDRIEQAWVRSRGGNARAGNEAGRIIRSYRGMLTRILAGWGCFSACNFMFMGGDRRVVDDGSAATTELIGSIEQSSALLASEDNDFLIRMGISRKLLTDIMYQQQAVQSEDNPSTRYCLTQAEVREYNVMPLEKPAP